MCEEITTHSTISEPIRIIRTQRGKRKLLLDGYIYRLDRLNDRGIEQWRCSKKNCRGRIHLHHSNLSRNQINITIVSSHSHASEPVQCEAAILVDHLRTISSSESAKEIVDHLFKSITDLPSIAASVLGVLSKNINRPGFFLVQRSRRQQKRSLHSYRTNIQHDDIEIFYHSINDTSLFPLTHLRSNQILVFTCDHQDKLANTSIWLCTTYTEIKTNFLQCILIVQIFDHERLIPILYAFLPSNINHFYIQLFQELFSSQTPKYILTNFDRILIDCLKTVFLNRPASPDIKICSVFLHHELCQFLQQDKRTIDEREYQSIKYLLTLAYIPSSDVVMAFETLQEMCLPSIEGVYNKFEDLCIGRLRPNGSRSQASFPLAIWNWTDVISDFHHLLLINQSIKQWDEIFRKSFSTNSHRNFSQIFRIIQQLYQHEMDLQINTNFIAQNESLNQFQHIMQSYGSSSFEEYLLRLIHISDKIKSSSVRDNDL